jgi:signal transduction histidine kinase
MSFAQIKRLSQRLVVRIAFFFSLLFIASAAVSYVVMYVQISNHLRASDKSIIEAKWREYSEVYRSSGLAGLTNALASDQEKEGDGPLLVQVLDERNNSLFLKVPGDSRNSQSELENRLRKRNAPDGWSDVASPHEEDKIEFLTQRIPGVPATLRVGKSSDPRDDILENLTGIFLAICGLFLVLGAGLGTFFAYRALRPLRQLVLTMKKVRKGALSSRVQVSHTKDETEELTTIFNQMLDRLELLVRGMRETLDHVAHDIRTPMTRIRTVAELRLKEPPGAEDRIALEECAESAETVSEILDSLLDLAEAESGAMRLRRESVNLAELVRPVIEMYDLVADDKAILVSFDAASDPPVWVDPSRIRQALGNLLDNAIKYSGSGTQISISATESADSVEVSITDGGVGISPEDLPRIWERLFRSDRSRSLPGLGLGLSLVKAIVGAHGGVVGVSSTLGQGSTFTVRLPKFPS